MKNQLKNDVNSNPICQEHSEKCTFVCLHKTCQYAFRIGCTKCRKDHFQHPNRLISIGDFHTMLAKPIRYIQNSTGFKLINLKKKNEYIRNFRTSILQKEILLIESNKNIKSTISSILQQHYYIRDIVSHLTPEKLVQNYQQYIEYLSRSKEFLAFNPVKGDLVFNIEVIKTGRINLEKYIKTSHDLIDNVREFLVKIIEVLIAHCAYQQDDDDIQIDQQGDNATNFNIFIKTRVNVIQNPNIKSKLEHQTFLQMFDEQKDSLNKQIELLQKQLDVKVQILRKIKGNTSKPKQSQISEQGIQSQLDKDISISDRQSKQKYFEEQSEYCKQTQESAKGIQTLNNKIIEIREQYQTIIAHKEQYIQELKHICSDLQEKITQSQKPEDNSQKEKLVPQEIYLEIKQNLQKQCNINKLLQEKIEQLYKRQHSILEKNKQLNQLIQKMTNQMNSLRQDYQLKIQQAQKNIQKQINEKNKKQNQLTKLSEQIQKKDKQVTKERKKYQQLQKMVDKMRQNSASSQKQLLKWRDQHQMRQKRLRIQLQGSQKQLQNLHYKIKIDSQKIKHLQTLAKQHNKTIDKTSNQLRQKEKELKAKDQLYKQKYQITTSRIKQLQIQLKNSQNTENTLKNFQTQSKKFKEMKEMLEISIKKNQELKDKIFKLQSQLQQYRHQMKIILKNDNNERINDNRKSFCLDQISRSKLKNFESDVSESMKFDTSNLNKEINSFSPSLKKKDSQIVLKDRKIVPNKKQAYLQIKSIFKAVTEDMGLLQQRLKQNNVVEKVYLKELQRKRLENKTLKKQLQNMKLYGGNSKQQNEQYRTTSPISKGIDKQLNLQNNINIGSPLSKKTQSQTGLGRKTSKLTK